MDNLQLQFAIAGIVNGLVQLTILIASIIILVKKRSIPTLILCIGSILRTIGFVGSYVYNIIAAQHGTEAIVQAQIIINYFNTFSYIVFGIGLLLIAITHFNKATF